MNQYGFRKLISGQGGGLSVILLRLFLDVSAAGYSLIVRLRDFLYLKGWLKTNSVNAMVFSIGNITVGGTGKTPLVIWLCKFLQQKQIPCAILTRGYKTRTEGRRTRDEGRETKIDEPAILAESCAEARVIVNPDRVAGAAEGVSRFGAKVLIMDDGFQHRRLPRDLDIVTIDATQPFGYGKLLPAGLLREPISALKRADAVAITRCDQIGEAKLTELEKKLKQINPNMITAQSIHAPVCAKSAESEEISLEELKNKKIFAFCGIGNPDAFLTTVKSLCSALVGSKVYNDHYRHTVDSLADIYEQAKHLKADLILTTQKDWTKISPLDAFNKDMPSAYLAIEIKFVAGEDKLTALIEDTIAGKIAE